MSAEIINKLKRRLVKRKTKSARVLMNGAGIFLKMEKKSSNMVTNNINIYLNMKRRLVDIEKIIPKYGKIKPLSK